MLTHVRTVPLFGQLHMSTSVGRMSSVLMRSSVCVDVIGSVTYVPAPVCMLSCSSIEAADAILVATFCGCWTRAAYGGGVRYNEPTRLMTYDDDHTRPDRMKPTAGE